MVLNNVLDAEMIVMLHLDLAVGSQLALGTHMHLDLAVGSQLALGTHMH